MTQNGWEQNPVTQPDGQRIVTPAVAHIQFHLAKSEKDFRDANVAESELAPDALAYALRLARWLTIPTSDLVPTQETQQQAEDTMTRYPEVSVAQAAFWKATSLLARNLHDFDHAKTKESAQREQPETCLQAARLLAYCADNLAQGYSFDLTTAFSTRLTNLRQRFGIPEPQTTEEADQ